MPTLIHCSRCGKITEELTINKKTISNCKECGDAHNNKCKTTKENHRKYNKKAIHQKNNKKNRQKRSKNQKNKQKKNRHRKQMISTKILLNEIINDLQSLTDIAQTNSKNTRDISQHINNKIDNTINNINNNGDITQNNNLTELIQSKMYKMKA